MAIGDGIIILPPWNGNADAGQRGGAGAPIDEGQFDPRPRDDSQPEIPGGLNRRRLNAPKTTIIYDNEQSWGAGVPSNIVDKVRLQSEAVWPSYYTERAGPHDTPEFIKRGMSLGHGPITTPGPRVHSFKWGSRHFSSGRSAYERFGVIEQSFDFLIDVDKLEKEYGERFGLEPGDILRYWQHGIDRDGDGVADEGGRNDIASWEKIRRILVELYGLGAGTFEARRGGTPAGSQRGRHILPEDLAQPDQFMISLTGAPLHEYEDHSTEVPLLMSKDEVEASGLIEGVSVGLVKPVYNYMLFDYERVLESALKPRGHTHLIPNIYVLTSELTNLETVIVREGLAERTPLREERDYRNFATVGGIIRGVRPRRPGPLGIISYSQKDYFCTWTGAINALAHSEAGRQEEFLAASEAFIQAGLNFISIIIPPEQLPFIKTANSNAEVYPMFNRIKFKTDERKQFANLFNNNRLSTFMMREGGFSEYFPHDGLGPVLNTFTRSFEDGHLGHPGTLRWSTTNRALSQGGQVTGGSQFRITDVHDFWEEIDDRGELLEEENELLSDPFAVMLGSNEGAFDANRRHLGDEVAQELRTILKERFRETLAGICKDSLRSYEEMMGGVLAKSQTVFYRIEKRLNGQLVQEFLVPNAEDLDIFEYIDTQVMYGNSASSGDTNIYDYKIYAGQLVIGSRYARFALRKSPSPGKPVGKPPPEDRPLEIPAKPGDPRDLIIGGHSAVPSGDEALTWRQRFNLGRGLEGWRRPDDFDRRRQEHGVGPDGGYGPRDQVGPDAPYGGRRPDWDPPPGAGPRGGRDPQNFDRRRQEHGVGPDGGYGPRDYAGQHPGATGYLPGYIAEYPPPVQLPFGGHGLSEEQRQSFLFNHSTPLPLGEDRDVGPGSCEPSPNPRDRMRRYLTEEEFWAMHRDIEDLIAGSQVWDDGGSIAGLDIINELADRDDPGTLYARLRDEAKERFDAWQGNLEFFLRDSDNRAHAEQVDVHAREQCGRGVWEATPPPPGEEDRAYVPVFDARAAQQHDPPDIELIKIDPSGNNDSDGTLYVKVKCGTYVIPSLKLIEVPIFDAPDVMILDKPPASPDINVIPYRGIDNQALITMNEQVSTHREQLPIFFNSAEKTDFANIMFTQYLNDLIEIDPVDVVAGWVPIIFGNDDPPSSYEVYKVDTPPESYEDFHGNLYHVATLTDENGRPLVSSAALKDSLIPNRKYYYTFRIRDIHGHVSNPTDVYQVELVNNAGAVYLLIDIYEFPEKPLNFTKNVRRFIKISPALAQTLVNAPRSNLVDDSGAPTPTALGTTVKLGLPDEGPWARKYKFRLTSKETGRKLDINIDFQVNQLQETDESGAGCSPEIPLNLASPAPWRGDPAALGDPGQYEDARLPGRRPPPRPGSSPWRPPARRPDDVRGAWPLVDRRIDNDLSSPRLPNAPGEVRPRGPAGAGPIPDRPRAGPYDPWES